MVRLVIHGLVSPTVMILMSKDCCRACKSFVVHLLSGLFRWKTTRACHELTLSKRSRALLQAKLATEWRRNQQPCNHYIMDRPMYHLSSTQPLPNLIAQSRGEAYSLTDLPNTIMRPRPPQPTESIRNVIHVRPQNDAQNIETSRRSEVILRCQQIRPMDAVPDPVSKIDSFKTEE